MGDVCHLLWFDDIAGIFEPMVNSVTQLFPIFEHYFFQHAASVMANRKIFYAAPNCSQETSPRGFVWLEKSHRIEKGVSAFVEINCSSEKTADWHITTLGQWAHYQN